MARLNPNAPEWVFFMGMLDERIAKHRSDLESENTKPEELAYERAKLRSVLKLKQLAQEALIDEHE